MSLFWVLCSVLFICMSNSLTISHSLDYYSYILNLKIRWCDSSNLLLFIFSTASNISSILVLLSFHFNMANLSIFAKRILEVLQEWNWVYSSTWRWNDPFIMVCLLIHAHGMSVYLLSIFQRCTVIFSIQVLYMFC